MNDFDGWTLHEINRHWKALKSGLDALVIEREKLLGSLDRMAALAENLPSGEECDDAIEAVSDVLGFESDAIGTVISKIAESIKRCDEAAEEVETALSRVA